jgi:hypothetical protein
MGSKTATLSIYSNDPVEPTVQITLTGNAVLATPCTLAIQPTELAFGDLPVGSKSTRDVQLINTSQNPCLVSGIEIAPGSDPAFTVDSATNLTIGPGATAVITVGVKVPPAAEEGETPTGFLRFAVNSAATPTVLVPLGVRVAACLVTTPSDQLIFGSLKVGCRSASKSVTLYNACASVITLNSIAIDQTTPGFNIISSPAIPNSGLSLRPGAPQSVKVAFSPSAQQPYVGGLVISATEAGVAKTKRVALLGSGEPDNTTTDSFTQPQATPADLLFVVDNSCSMFDEQASLAANFASFITYANQLKVPYQIGVTTTDDGPLGAQGRLLRTTINPAILTPSTNAVAVRFAEKVNVGTNGSGLEQPLSAALKAVTPPLINTTNRGFLRADSSLSIIVVSDANDQSIGDPISAYLNRFLGLFDVNRASLFTFSTIGPFTPIDQLTCDIDNIPDNGRYAPIIAATNGVKVDICTKDWARDLEVIGRNALGPRSTIYLTGTPDQTQTIRVTVNGTTLFTGWSYDPVLNAVLLQDTAVTPPGAKINVTYEGTCF